MGTNAIREMNLGSAAGTMASVAYGQLVAELTKEDKLGWLILIYKAKK